ncbi:glycosyltransferase family 39 protein [Arenimonas composti]|uniref:Glycosyltransferase RgtA/B/C/D-like domain-containing protein n=1 Tax=Arenimonas composti TR7-09 = DSM 18010 TaxID=1121013 RepID=A0A091BF23_9GAMM|nr:glycosyltransferase family 39 protein [Arenimonas composti]KFN51308.1 hypothetical protein P873_03305 [Arenimonas composti TR7-09 = DSM 18010]
MNRADTPVPGTAAPAEPPAPPRLLVVAVVAVALLHVACFAWYVPNNDFIRDLVHAGALAHGEALPLRGPTLNEAFDLGPLWFWLLALPLALGAGFAGTGVFVGVLSTLKLVFGWRLGTRLGGPWLALAVAALLLAPGWDLMHKLQLTHTVVLETLLLAAWLPLLTLWRGGGGRQWALFGGVAGLAGQAHPVAMLLALPAAVVLWRRRTRWRGDIGWLASGLVLALLPLAPMLVAEWREGWPMLASIETRWTAPPDRPPTTPPQLGWAVTGGVWTLLRALLPAGYAAVAGCALLVCVGIAAAGLPTLRGAPRLRRVAIPALLLAIVAIVLVALLRERTPSYMAVVLSPPLLFVLAAPLAALAARGRGGLFAATFGLLAALVAGAAGSFGWIAATTSGHLVLPLQAIGDVRHVDRPGTALAGTPLHALDAIAAAQCDAGVLRVHGELAALVDYYHALMFRLPCPGLDLALMGDDAGARHWAAMTPHALHVLGFAEAGWADAAALQPRRVIAPASGVRVAEVYDHAFPAVAPGAEVERVLAFDAAGDEAVAVYSPLFLSDAAHGTAASCDGEPVAPAVRTNAGALFLPPGGRGCRWEVRAWSRVPDQLDVITLGTYPVKRDVHR